MASLTVCIISNRLAPSSEANTDFTSLHCLELNFSTLYGIALICTALYFTALQPVRTVKTLRLQCRCHHCCKVLVKCVRVLFSYLSFFSTADHPSNFATIMVVRVGHLTAQCSTLVLTCNPTAYTRLSFCQSVTSRRPRCYFWLGGIYKYSPPPPNYWPFLRYCPTLKTHK